MKPAADDPAAASRRELPAPLAGLDRLLARLEDGLALLAGAGVAVLAVLLVVDLLRRRLADETIVWLYNFSGLYVFSAAIFLSLAHAHRTDSHIALDVVAERLPPAWRRAATALGETLGICLFTLLAWIGFHVTSEAFRENYVGDVALPWPLWTHYVLLPVGAAMAALRSLLKLLGSRDPAASASEDLPLEPAGVL